MAVLDDDALVVLADTLTSEVVAREVGVLTIDRGSVDTVVGSLGERLLGNVRHSVVAVSDGANYSRPADRDRADLVERLFGVLVRIGTVKRVVDLVGLIVRNDAHLGAVDKDLVALDLRCVGCAGGAEHANAGAWGLGALQD